ncbi:MAG: HAMP domain-containing sensor histidine kinase [Pseudomonadota bacterium]
MSPGPAMPMPSNSSEQKWRPSLGQVTLAVLAMAVTLPLVGLFFFRVIENQLIRETESELIAQSAVLAGVFAREAEAPRADLPLGTILPVDARPDPSRRFDPILPALDLTAADLLPSRPDGRPAEPPGQAALTLGRRMTALGQEVQRVTLAGFRFLDATGVVIGGSDEVGLSFAHIAEVRAAMAGRYASVIRSRIRDTPPPPLYSISRGTTIRIFVAMPVVVGQRVAGVVYASRTPNNIVKYFYAERVKLALASLVVAAAVGLIGWSFLRLINRPVARLIGWTEEIARGVPPDAAPRPAGRLGTREIARLADSFETMARALQHRSDYIATFAQHVSHELKSPLTTIQGAAELIREGDLAESERHRLADTILADTGRLSDLLTQLRALARAERAVPGAPVALEAMRGRLTAAHPDLELGFRGALARPLAMPEESLSILLGHLLDNSAAHGARRVEIAVASEGAKALVDVSDDGSGISPGNRARIFDAFFTTRRETGGTGLGLEIVKTLLATHGGEIALVPSGKGASFRVTVPLAV